MNDILNEIISASILIPITLLLLKYLISNLTKQINEIKLSVWKYVLEDEFIIDYARTKVWFASEKKLKFIKERLTKNDLRNREIQVKKSITAELQRITQEYIVFFNKFNTKIWLIWNYIENNFELKDFQNEIFDIVFRKKRNNHSIEFDNELKINDIKFIMMDYQTRLFKKLWNELLK